MTTEFFQWVFRSYDLDLGLDLGGHVTYLGL